MQTAAGQWPVEAIWNINFPNRQIPAPLRPREFPFQLVRISSVRRGTQLCDTLLQGSQLCDTLLQGSQFCDTTAYREAIRQASQFCDAFYMDHNSVIIVAIGRQVYRVITLVLPITQRAKNDTTI